MKPYEIINCLLQSILSEEYPAECEHLIFHTEPRHEYINGKDNQLQSKFQFDEKHYYDYYNKKWRDFIDNNSLLQHAINYRIMPHFIDHSFEPINVDLDKEYWDPKNKQQRIWPNSLGGTRNKIYKDFLPKDYPLMVLHSEHNSKDIEQIEAWTYKTIHWFSHAYLCSEYYFKLYNNLEIVTNYTARPINHAWICANRLLRKHRTDFLEMLDLERGCYSLANPDPNGIIYNGPVAARSFDDHTNSSAEICVTKLTPWNTSFLHVVSETIWQDKIHFTEKVFKPIVLHQPFVVLQAPGSLAYLRSYGFKTFGNWWDESYDTIEDPTARMQAIADIVNSIGTKSLEELETMRMEMASVLENNFRHFYENIPAICLDELRKGIANL